ncbi:MAG: carboxymuconolactone decarboxylase family protein [Thermoleophilaceae bacterium]|nr:carboxymuconolactone decarboxylase family protein [Thermoleophilaceae bacterium]
MSNVELIESQQAPLLVQGYYGPDGSASPITRALAQVPELAEVALPFIGRALAPGVLDERTVEIIVLRVSALNACPYCVATHTVLAWDAGLSEAETGALGSPAGERGRFEPREEALVAFCEAFCAAPSPVPRKLLDALRDQGFADHELVDLALVAGATLMLNRFCTALGLEPSEATRERLEAVGAAA